jgi:hypothetical protein
MSTTSQWAILPPPATNKVEMQLRFQFTGANRNDSFSRHDSGGIDAILKEGAVVEKSTTFSIAESQPAAII